MSVDSHHSGVMETLNGSVGNSHQTLQSPTESLRESKHGEREEEEVARTTKTEKSSDGGKTTTTTTTTTQKTRDGAHVVTKQTRQITKVGVLGSTNYRINATQADDIAERLATVFQSKALPGTAGLISVRTESWNSNSGQKIRSCKMQPWGVPDKCSEEQQHPQQQALLQQQHQQQPEGTAAARLQSAETKSPSTSPSSNAPPTPLPRHLPQRASANAPAVQRSVTSIKQVLLDWCKATVADYPNVSVTNFSSSWSDGLAFCALIHHFYPNAFDFNELSAINRRSNFQLAFDTAEKYAKIAPLLDVEDMVQMASPDWKCVFTYLQSFYRRFAVAQRQQQRPPQPPSTPTSHVARPSQLLESSAE